MSKKHLSVSQIRRFLTCPQSWKLAYIDRLERVQRGEASERGVNFHALVDAYKRQQKTGGEAFTAACAELGGHYDPFEYQKIVRMAGLWVHRWQDDDNSRGFVWAESEQKITLPLINPATGAPSTTTELLCILDGVIHSPAGVLLIDHKTTTMDIAPGGDYQQKLEHDLQISLYWMAAVRLGLNPIGFIYDMIRMPQIRPRALTKKEKAEIVDTGMYSGESVGEELRATIAENISGDWTETPNMYGARLVTTVVEDWDRYFQRVQVVRTQQQIEAAQRDLWAVHKSIQASVLANGFPHNAQACTSPYRCEFFELCHRGDASGLKVKEEKK